MGVENKVIAGGYTGKGIITSLDGLKIILGFTKGVFINKNTIEGYKLVDINDEKNITSGLVRSVIGNALFGTAGAIVGANSAKLDKVYIVEVQFKDGKQSVIQLESHAYNILRLMADYSREELENMDRKEAEELIQQYM